VPHGRSEASPLVDVARLRWKKQPRCGIAVTTGHDSDLFVVDVDGAEGEKALAWLQRKLGPLPATWEQTTGRGRQLWFRFAAGLPTTAGRFGPEIDTRGEGGYAVAPPSPHILPGASYAWKQGHGPRDRERAQLSPFWLEYLQAPARGAASRAPLEWVVTIDAPCREGQRHTTMLELVGLLFASGPRNPHVVRAFIRLWSETRCQPPLPTAEIDRAVADIHRRELQKARGDA
jgi:hypothetical protein